MLGELAVVGARLESRQDAPVVGAIGAVVEQRDIPAGAEHLQEAHERTGGLGERNAEEPFGQPLGGASADHGAHMDLGELVVGQVDDAVAHGLQVAHDLSALLAPTGEPHTHEDARRRPGRGRGGDPVVELGDGPPAQHRGEAEELPLDLGNGHAEDRLALLADLAALGDVAQLVEVEVRPREHAGQSLPLQAVGGDVLLQTRQGDGAAGLGHGAQILEEVAHGGGGLVGGDGDDVVEEGRAQAEGLIADPAHGDALGEQADALESDRPGGVESCRQAGGLLVLDADDGDIGHELLDQDGDPRSQTAAAHGHEDAVELGVLLNHLQPDGALTGDHPRVVERGDEGQPLGGGQALGLGLGGVEVLSDQADLSPQRAHGVDLDARGDGGHDDSGPDTQDRGAARDSLGVVARRGGHHAAGALGFGQGAHGVVGAADLEGVDCLEVLALDLHGAAEARGQGGHLLQGRVLGGLIDGGAQDGAQILGGIPGGSGDGLIHGPNPR